MHVIPLGINLEGYDLPERAPHSTFNVGFFARVAPEKGLHLLVESYVRLRARDRFRRLHSARGRLPGARASEVPAPHRTPHEGGWSGG